MPAGATMGAPDRVTAPFDQRAVSSLNAFQRSGADEVVVCPSALCGAVLLATRGGWECPSPVCEYSQDWAWSWMADWSWCAPGAD
jgi:hypothetical protein